MINKISEGNLRGRNNFELKKLNGVICFEKSIIGEHLDAGRRFKNLILWDKISNSEKFKLTPKIVSSDVSNLSLMYEYFKLKDNAIDYSKIDNITSYKKDMLQAINLLSEVHMIDIKKYFISKIDVKRGIDIVKAVNIEMFINATGAELEFLRLCQNDKVLLDAVEELKKLRISQKKLVLSHGDFRPDQIIETKKGWMIIDFEELCLAYGEFDIANYFAAIIFPYLISALTNGLNEIYSKEELEEAIESRVFKIIDALIPIFQELINEYEKKTNISLDAILLSREFGWAILERVYSRAKFSYKLSSCDKAIMGIARMIVVEPKGVGWKGDKND